MRKIGYLLEQIRLAGETAEVKDEVIRLSKQYGVITPYTSYLILEEDRLAVRPQQGAPAAAYRYRAAREALAEPPAGAASEAEAGGEPAVRLHAVAKRAAEAFDRDGGAAGVDSSRKTHDLKAGVAGGEVARFLEEHVNRGGLRVKDVAERTFYLQGTRWVDSVLTLGKAWDESKARHVKYLSDEYFALLGDEPGIGAFLSVGEEVTFVWKDKVIAVDV